MRLCFKSTTCLIWKEMDGRQSSASEYSINPPHNMNTGDIVLARHQKPIQKDLLTFIPYVTNFVFPSEWLPHYFSNKWY